MAAAVQLALELKAELQKTCGLLFPPVDLLPTWLLSTEMTLKLSDDDDWDLFVQELDAYASHSSKIHGHWRIEDDTEDAVYILMGRDVWQSTRCDRFAGSRVISVENNDAVDSTNRMQTMRVVNRSSDCNRGIYHVPAGQTTTYQTFAHLFRTALRLGPRDTGNMIDICAKYGLN
ncbi:uncharacterized protein RCC_07607 [Ramularia collo-cygni]|uniref:Uncharacterized protein n=1 Tax=Ramularia collo-cygni TaxID=112498 RepID=A0A2D3UVI9_9PEZI|nr:uncharacterized protein RCC_07607 [Ramularia collo-cygni]CZT21742.1 uncharacterized protein RCC_07607 [Ramularia collo-cygni]